MKSRPCHPKRGVRIALMVVSTVVLAYGVLVLFAIRGDRTLLQIGFYKLLLLTDIECILAGAECLLSFQKMFMLIIGLAAAGAGLLQNTGSPFSPW